MGPFSESLSILFSAIQVHDKVDDWLRENLVKVQLLEQIHQVRQEHYTDCLYLFGPVYSLWIVLSDLLYDGHALNEYQADTVLAYLLQDLQQSVVGTRLDQILITTGMVGVAEFLETVLEEIYVALIIIDKEREYIRCLNEALQLRLLISGQRNGIQTVVVHDVDHVENLAIYVNIN